MNPKIDQAANNNFADGGSGAPKPQNIKPAHNELKLFAYAMSGEIEKLKSVIISGVNINAASVISGCPVRGEFGKNTALMFAAAAGEKEAVAFLLKHGANPSIRNLTGETAHCFALQNNDCETAMLLVQAMERRRGYSSNDDGDDWNGRSAA